MNLIRGIDEFKDYSGPCRTKKLERSNYGWELIFNFAEIFRSVNDWSYDVSELVKSIRERLSAMVLRCCYNLFVSDRLYRQLILLSSLLFQFLLGRESLYFFCSLFFSTAIKLLKLFWTCNFHYEKGKVVLKAISIVKLFFIFHCLLHALWLSAIYSGNSNLWLKCILLINVEVY